MKNEEMTLPLFWRLAGWLIRSIPSDTLHRIVLQSHGLAKALRQRGYTTHIQYDIGESIVLSLDDWIPYQLFLTGTYYSERYEAELFRRSVRPEMVVFDVGANIGFYTLQAAIRVGPFGQVHAFEPVLKTNRLLRENVELNGFHNVTINRAAVQQEEGSVTVFCADDTQTGTSSLRCIMKNFAAVTENVGAISIDSYVEREHLSRVDLVKLDIEGSELSALRGMHRLLAKKRVAVLVEISRHTLGSQAATPEELIDYMAGYGYRGWTHCHGRLTRLNEQSISDFPLVLFMQDETLHTAH
jgi:FkbM family methyltransferase